MSEQIKKKEIMKEPLDISGDYERIFKSGHIAQALLDWWSFLRSIENIEFVKLKIDLSKTNRDTFVDFAKWMKGFREGGASKLDMGQYPYKKQRRIAIIKCTKEQKEQFEEFGLANVFMSGVEWEEVK